MDNRQQHLVSILNAQPVITHAIQDKVLADLAVSPSKGVTIANRLQAIDSDAAKTRAEFILRQVSGEVAEELFDTWREKWGIPWFQEELVGVSDFQNGFMWRFRDHTTSWSENQQAQEWFLTSVEAQTTTLYELWSCDDGPAECIETVTGTYKQILEELLVGGVYEVLVSPVFTSVELNSFIKEFDEKEHDFALEEVIDDYISHNPNFVAE